MFLTSGVNKQLDKTKFKTTFHKVLPHWTQGVEECLKKLS